MAAPATWRCTAYRNRYENTYTRYLELRDGRIVNAIAFFDSIEFSDLWTKAKPQTLP
ncbi:MAG: hypothetical protein ACREA0_20910 [bacterium]